MNTIREFGATAKGLTKNPLGIIALFIVLIYGFASIVLGSVSHLEALERYTIVLFLVIFPVVVLAVFGWLVSCHYEKLYSPRDFTSDEAFLKALHERQEGRPGLIDLDRQIEEKIKTVLFSDELISNSNNKSELEERLRKAAETITNDIRNSSFITIDARSFTGEDEDIFEFPASAFSSLNELVDEIYFAISDCVRMFEYGESWVIKNPKNNELIKSTRMIAGIKRPKSRLNDTRSLPEIGIVPGIIFDIVKPKNA